MACIIVCKFHKHFKNGKTGASALLHSESIFLATTETECQRNGNYFCLLLRKCQTQACHSISRYTDYQVDHFNLPAYVHYTDMSGLGP